MNKFYGLFAVGFGLLSLCAAIVPVCGGSLAVLGLVTGLLGRRAESEAMANVGIAISILGALIAISYMIFLSITPSGL